MLSRRLQRIQNEVKKYDKSLFVYENRFGIALIMRQADRLEASDYNQIEPEVASLHPQIIFALTDDWKATGHPVEWGLEPIMRRLRWMDLWNDPEILERVQKNNETCERDEERQKHNTIRAMVADMRTDLNKAFKDYNTRYMPDYDRRRMKDGSLKS